ncbi:MAG: metallophosphoesterase [Caulobacterales bacterium]
MEQVTIAHISDLHFGDADPAALYAAREALIALNPDVVACSGDLTQGGRTQEFADAAKWLADLPFPLVVAPGNHDAPVYNVLSRLTRPKRRFVRLMLATSWSHAELGVRVRAFDTARPVQLRRDWSQGVYDLKDLDEMLEEGGRLVLVAHHPPVTPPGAQVESDARRGKRALERMAKHNGLVLLCGHTHKFYVGRLGGGPLTVVAPSLSSFRQRGETPGFVSVQIAFNGVSAALHNFDGNEFKAVEQVTVEAVA